MTRYLDFLELYRSSYFRPGTELKATFWFCRSIICTCIVIGVSLMQMCVKIFFHLLPHATVLWRFSLFHVKLKWTHYAAVARAIPVWSCGVHCGLSNASPFDELWRTKQFIIWGLLPDDTWELFFVESVQFLLFYYRGRREYYIKPLKLRGNYIVTYLWFPRIRDDNCHLTMKTRRFHDA
jgi:hypothetical protein